ncbi:hypothetical protein BGW39_008018 [Mortierella sp. 14UC]|nr:hypothetical protein BGW39_008018 [Mortierella sp. 14UC]
MSLEEMITFTQEHCRLFPNLLMIARCHNDAFASNDDSPQEIQFRLLQSLPPLIKPTALNDKNWIQFAAKLQETDLSFVTSIAPLPFGSSLNKSMAVVVDTPFLHRYRALESIDIPSLDDDSFQWAVTERKQYDIEIEAGRIPQCPLVPLRNLTINYRKPAFGRQINDAAFAFGRTLRSMSASGDWWGDLTDFEKEHGFAIGADKGELCWNVPQLSNIAIIVRWTPAELPELRELYLVGTPAISFHPDTLRSTVNLERMEMTMTTTRAASRYILPAEEFDSEADGTEGDGGSDDDIEDSLRPEGFHSATPSAPSIPRKRPTWTWDWDLPKLVELTLNGEFAYKFKFKFLDKAPSLLYFSVDITSWSRQHGRTVEMADLLRPGFQHPELAHFLGRGKQRSKVIDSTDCGDADDTGFEDDQVWKEFQYVRVPAMSMFILTGPWSLESRVLEVLFGKVVPSIQDLTMWSQGYSVGEWVTSTKHLY